jgi:hypothetical protein
MLNLVELLVNFSIFVLCSKKVNKNRKGIINIFLI